MHHSDDMVGVQHTHREHGSTAAWTYLLMLPLQQGTLQHILFAHMLNVNIAVAHTDCMSTLRHSHMHGLAVHSVPDCFAPLHCRAHSNLQSTTDGGVGLEGSFSIQEPYSSLMWLILPCPTTEFNDAYCRTVLKHTGQPHKWPANESPVHHPLTVQYCTMTRSLYCSFC